MIFGRRKKEVRPQDDVAREAPRRDYAAEQRKGDSDTAAWLEAKRVSRGAGVGEHYIQNRGKTRSNQDGDS